MQALPTKCYIDMYMYEENIPMQELGGQNGGRFIFKGRLISKVTQYNPLTS